MGKLYLFGIGGTGSRVIKHLTFLLATGMTLKNTDTVVPIIIDPDKGNGDLNKTLDIIILKIKWIFFCFKKNTIFAL